MRKVCVVVTARPSYSRIKTAMRAIRDRQDLDLQLVVAGSALLERYGTAVRTIENDGFEVSARVPMVLEGGDLVSMAKTTGLGLLELATVFGNLRPDVIVTVADRFETIATAIAAAYMNIPVAHTMGGEVTGTIVDAEPRRKCAAVVRRIRIRQWRGPCQVREASLTRLAPRIRPPLKLRCGQAADPGLGSSPTAQGWPTPKSGFAASVSLGTRIA